MAIISRVPGVALLLVGLTLLSGNARAAEPSYDDYVAQVKAGKLDIDYTAFRMAYTASPKYEPYGAARALIGQIKKAYVAGDCPAAMAHAKEVLEVNFVQIDAHMVTASCLKKAGNEEEARRAHAVFIGLVKSLARVGVMERARNRLCRHRHRRGVRRDGGLVGDAGQAGTDPSEDLPTTGSRSSGRDLDQLVTLYFNVDRPRGAIVANVAEHVAPEEAVDDRATAAFSSLPRH